jgi:hypothetical protein
MTNQTKSYGQLQSEKMAEESKTARQIVREIDHFGINDRQRWLIIYYLAMELENVDEMKEVTGFIKEFKGDSLFISKLYGGSEEAVTNG